VLSRAFEGASRQEFLLYWSGFLIVIFGSVLILMAISDLLTEVLSYRCWYPVLSQLVGFSEPSRSTQVAQMPVYCVNAAVAVVRFVFKFLAELILLGAGVYMMISGKKS
jgi:hypothetical protein